MSICSVIMAGGSGTRLWPLSRAAYSKQFHRLHGEDNVDFKLLSSKLDK